MTEAQHHRIALNDGLSGGKPIQRIVEGDKVRYTNVMLLAPGEWTDAASRQELFYAPDAISRSCDNWIDPRSGEEIEKAPLNHYHEHDVPSENVGHVDVASTFADNEGRLFSDIVFHCKTQRSREMEEMMKLAMEEDGQEGLGGISVEIPDDDTEWDDDRQMHRMTEMWFSGAGLVQNPASATVAFKNQSERAVALADGTESPRSLYTRRGERSITTGDAQGDMGDQNPIARFRELREKMTETVRQLQDDASIAADAVAQYLEMEENTPEDDLSAFEAWAAETLDEEMLSAVQSALASFRETLGDEEMATVGALNEWADAPAEDAEGDGEGEAPEMPELADEEGGPMDNPEGDGAVPEETVKEVADTLETVVESVDTAAQELKNEVGEAEDTAEEAKTEVNELKQELSEVTRRLKEIEESPNIKTLTDGNPDDDAEGVATTVPSPRVSNDGYIER